MKMKLDVELYFQLIHNKNTAGSINYLPTQLLPSSRSEYPFMQEQK